MLAKASYFASGQKLDISRTDPKDALGDALEYLIQNAYPKMGFIQHLHANPKQEIQSTLRANDVEQVTLGPGDAGSQPAGAGRSARVHPPVRDDQQADCAQRLIEKRYGGRPYGWPELEVVLLVARLAVLKEINLVVNAAPLPLDQAYDHLTSTEQAAQSRHHPARSRPRATSSRRPRRLGKELFAQQGPAAEEALFTVPQGAAFEVEQ